MSYTLNLANGNVLVSIDNGMTDTTYSSLTLFGKNSVDYGKQLNENLLHIMENFSNSSEPHNPLQGQLWWDLNNKRLNIRAGSNWKTVSGPTATATEPVTDVVGDLWWDTENKQLKVYNGEVWSVIGPIFTSQQGISGPIVETVAGSDGLPRMVVKNYVSGTLVSIVSKEPTFNISSLSGFSAISPGVNLPSGFRYYGDSQNALSLGGVLAANYLRGDVASISTQPLTIENNLGLTVGSSNNLTIGYDNTSGEARIVSDIVGQPFAIRLNLAGVTSQVLRADGTTGLITVAGDPVDSLGVASKRYVDSTIDAAAAHMLRADGSNSMIGNISPNSDGQWSIGSAMNRLATVHTIAVESQTISAQSGSFSSATVTTSPHQVNQVTPKGYVDALVNEAVASSEGYTNSKVSEVIGPAPSNLSTLKDIAAAINNDPGYFTAVETELVRKAALDSPVFIGVPLTPTANFGDRSHQIADTTFVNTAIDDAIDTVVNTANAYSDTKFASLNTTPIDGLIVNGNITTETNAQVDIGSITNQFRTLYCVSTTAVNADLAENYVADAEYSPGTVLVFGGDKEVTMSTGQSTRVAGIVSSEPAYLMNGNCEGDHVAAIALQGRCLVRVFGPVCKGDILVGASNGKAIVNNNPPVGVSIGKSLGNFGGSEGFVEVAVSRF